MKLEDFFLPSSTGILGALITWLLGKKKEEALTKASELDNMEKAVRLWREMAEELKKQVDDLSDKVDNLMQEVHSLRLENNELKQTISISKKKSSKV